MESPRLGKRCKRTGQVAHTNALWADCQGLVKPTLDVQPLTCCICSQVGQVFPWRRGQSPIRLRRGRTLDSKHPCTFDVWSTHGLRRSRGIPSLGTFPIPEHNSDCVGMRKRPVAGDLSRRGWDSPEGGPPPADSLREERESTMPVPDVYAERVGFEPTIPLRVYHLSRVASSTAPAPLPVERITS